MSTTDGRLRAHSVVQEGATAHLAAHREARHFPHVEGLRKADRERTEDGPVHMSAGALTVMSGPVRHIRRIGIAALRPVAWVNLLLWPGGVYAAGTVVKPRGRPLLSRMESGEFPKSVATAVRRLRCGCRPRHEDQFRLVEIRALHTHMVWLHRRDSTDHDTFVPLLPNPLKLIPGRLYSKESVDRLLKSAARRAYLKWM